VNEQERVARSIEAHAAQKLTISEAADLLEREGRDLQDGLEVAGTRNPDDGIPADMESIDPGWEGLRGEADRRGRCTVGGGGRRNRGGHLPARVSRIAFMVVPLSR
jgi:hypothetical protein